MDWDIEIEMKDDFASYFGDKIPTWAEALVALAAQRMEERAKELVPVASGALRRSITHQVEGLEATVSAGGGVEGVNYAEFVELGTARMAARPFLIPAFEEGREWLLNRAASFLSM